MFSGDAVGVGVGVGEGVGYCPQYRPPVLVPPELPTPSQTIISLPVQTAVCWYRASGALVVLVAVQLFVLGLYLPPVLEVPQTIISLPVQIAV